LFGDTALAAVLAVVPFDLIASLKLVSAGSGIAVVILSGFVLGLNRYELRVIGRFLLVGVILSYASFASILRAFGVRAGHAAHAAKGKIHDRRVKAESVASTAREFTPPPAMVPAKPVQKSPRLGFVRRDPTLSTETPRPVTPAAARAMTQTPAPDRIGSRISDAVRKRRQAAVTSPAQPTATSTQIKPVRPSNDPYFQDETTPLAAEPTRYSAPTPQSNAVVQHREARPLRTSRKAAAEQQPSLEFEEKHSEFETPPLNLLSSPSSIIRHHLSDEALEENARMLENVLDDYGVKGEIVSVSPGPVVTMYELEPAPGLKASRVIGLADDIARSMSALSARVSTVPGRSIIGIELPNEQREKVLLREILAAREFGDSSQKLPLALGKNIGGDPIVANLAKMPHLLIAGTTGSGKSVAINTMILSLLYKLSPDECRMIMIDPKMLELSVYDGIPHLLSPVVTDPKKAVVALKWVVGEMEERYRKMSKMGVRNIDGYNSRVKEALSKDQNFSRTVQTGFDDDTGEPVFETEEFKPESMPFIVVIVDEMADLMMVAGKEIEACIQRLAQMARASGIHLIMATQRPSVDVITGTIKANFPTRISFQVTSKIDSRTILGEMGAEQLLGMGDMLYMEGGGKITRVHGPFVSDEEVEEIVNHLKSFGTPEYVSGVVDGPDEGSESSIDLVLGLGGNTTGEDALLDQAVAIVLRDRKCSTSYIQRKLAIGYNKAARLVEQMEDNGLVSQANHVGKREILVPEGQ
jgi:S-DNA-T family DNA segregation ATPase FtsK/SpoIIIE